jgi:hypothetical protein
VRLALRSGPMSRQCFLCDARHLPRASLPAQGITPCGMVSRTMSERVTSPSSLIPAHAPDQNPPHASVSPLYIRSLQVAASPYWKLALPVVISAIYIWLSRPIPRRDFPVLVSVSSWKTSVSRNRVVVRLTKLSLQCNFYRGEVFEAAVIP